MSFHLIGKIGLIHVKADCERSTAADLCCQQNLKFHFAIWQTMYSMSKKYTERTTPLNFSLIQSTKSLICSIIMIVVAVAIILS